MYPSRILALKNTDKKTPPTPGKRGGGAFNDGGNAQLDPICAKSGVCDFP